MSQNLKHLKMKQRLLENKYIQNLVNTRNIYMEISMFFFVEGISGAGKTTYVNKHLQNNSVIIEGDCVKPRPFINGERISIEDYKRQHRDGLEALCEIKAQNVVVVGGVLHGVEYDLIGIYDFDKERVIQYIEEITAYLPKKSQIIYLETTNVSETIKSVLRERYSLRPDWVRGILDFVERTVYCKKMGWNGEDGVIQLIKMIYECDKDILIFDSLNTMFSK